MKKRESQSYCTPFLWEMFFYNVNLFVPINLSVIIDKQEYVKLGSHSMNNVQWNHSVLGHPRIDDTSHYYTFSYSCYNALCLAMPFSKQIYLLEVKD